MENTILKEEDQKTTCKITIVGHKMALRSEHSQDHLQKLANYVTNQVNAIQGASSSISTHQSVLLVALQFADMINQKNNELNKLKDIIRKKASLALLDVENALDELALEESEDKHP